MNAPRPPMPEIPGVRRTGFRLDDCASPAIWRHMALAVHSAWALRALSSALMVLMAAAALTGPGSDTWAAAPAAAEAKADPKAAPKAATPTQTSAPGSPKAPTKPAAPTAVTAPAVPLAKLMPGSEIVFVSKQLGVPVEGRFGRFEAQIALDPRNPASGRVAFSIDTASASIGDAETDRELAKPDWFGVARFPQASFESTAIKALGGGRFEVAGRLSIKGTSRDAVVPVTLTQTGANSLAVGSFSIQRNAFGIGGGAWADTSLVADDVQVKFKLSLTGLGPL